MLNLDKIYFNHSPKPTIGVEAELYTVSRDDYNLCSIAPKILKYFKNDLHVKEELLECIVEVNTGICNNVSEVREDLINQIHKVREKAAEYNAALISIGTHPFSQWKDQNITSSPRYISFLERMQWPVKRLIISGLHVHIGVAKKLSL